MRQIGPQLFCCIRLMPQSHCQMAGGPAPGRETATTPDFVHSRHPAWTKSGVVVGSERVSSPFPQLANACNFPVRRKSDDEGRFRPRGVPGMDGIGGRRRLRIPEVAFAAQGSWSGVTKPSPLCHLGTSPVAMMCSRASSSRMGTPRETALSYFEPAASPATT